MNPSDLKLDTVIRLTKEIENPSPEVSCVVKHGLCDYCDGPEDLA